MIIGGKDGHYKFVPTNQYLFKKMLEIMIERIRERVYYTLIITEISIRMSPPTMTNKIMISLFFRPLLPPRILG